MNKMIDPRNCENFRLEEVCPNWDQEIMLYLDNRVISDISLTFEPEMFDRAFEFCASCDHYAPVKQLGEQGQAFH